MKGVFDELVKRTKKFFSFLLNQIFLAYQNSIYILHGTKGSGPIKEEYQGRMFELFQKLM